MIPIYLYGEAGRQGLMFRDFERCLVSICAEHQKAGRASAFGLILFDFTSPQIARVFDDPAYWAALDAISGKALSVFAVHARIDKDLGEREPSERLDLYRSVHRTTRQGLAKYFDLERVAFPVLLLFQVQEEKIAGSLFIALKEHSTEGAFREIKEILELAARSVVDSAGLSLKNPERAFHAIEEAMSQRRLKMFVKSGAAVGMRLLELVGILK